MRFKVAFVDSLAVGSRRAADPLKRLSHDMRRLHFAVHLTEAPPTPLAGGEGWVWKGQVKTVIRVIYSTIVQRKREGRQRDG